MKNGILSLITSLGVLKIYTMTLAEQKLQDWFEQLMVMAEKTSQNEQDSIILAGAFMNAAKALYYNNLRPEEASHIMETNTVDFIKLIKPTIH